MKPRPSLVMKTKMPMINTIAETPPRKTMICHRLVDVPVGVAAIEVGRCGGDGRCLLARGAIGHVGSASPVKTVHEIADLHNASSR